MVNRRNLIIGGGVAAVAVVGGIAYLTLGRSSNATAVEGAIPSAPGATVEMAKLMAPAGDVADHAIGGENAKVVVIEYLSPTCPHCAVFHSTVYPQLKAEYIDTGKIKFIPRPFVRNVLDAVVFMLAEAAGPAKYHDVLDTYFRTQNEWAMSQTPNDAMFAIAQQLGFTKESYDAALTNQTLFSGMEKLRDQALNEFKLQGTPTFYINGKMLTGENSLEAFKAEIDPLLG